MGEKGWFGLLPVSNNLFVAPTEEILASAGDGKLVHDSQERGFIFNILPIFCMFCLYNMGNFWTTKMLQKKKMKIK